MRQPDTAEPGHRPIGFGDRGEPAVRSYAVTHPGGTVVLPQPDGWDQLVHASSGVMTVHTADLRWVVPPRTAVWVPSGLTHTIELSGRVKLRSLYLQAGLASGVTSGLVSGSGLASGLAAGLAGRSPSTRSPGAAGAERAGGSLVVAARPVNVSPLLRELILQAVADAPLWLDDPRHARLIGVLLDHLELLDDVPLQLPLPRDPRAAAVAAAILADAGSPVALASLARDAGAGVRTIERRFRSETAMTVQQWRTRARLLLALRLLAAGDSVTTAAVSSGYSSPSAFAAAFKHELGVPPSRFFAGDQRAVRARADRRVTSRGTRRRGARRRRPRLPGRRGWSC